MPAARLTQVQRGLVQAWGEVCVDSAYRLWSLKLQVCYLPGKRTLVGIRSSIAARR